LTAETLVEKKNSRGVLELMWHRLRRDNHYGDCEKMQLVQGHLLMPNLQAKTEKPTSAPHEPQAGPQPNPMPALPRNPFANPYPRRIGKGWVNSWR